MLQSGKTLGREFLKSSAKIELIKRKYGLFSKSVGQTYIPMAKLQGLITAEGKADVVYKGKPITLSVE